MSKFIASGSDVGCVARHGFGAGTTAPQLYRVSRTAGLVKSHEEACERVAALFSSRWLRGYVGNKLGSDPLFPLAYELLRDSDAPILDVGCGVGLLAFYLRERGLKQALTGVDIDERKIRRAIESAARGRYAELCFAVQDVAHELPPACGNVAVFDLLHYLPRAAQQHLSRQLAARVAPGGVLLLRECPRDNSARYHATYVAEVFAQMISWNWTAPLHFPTSDSINDAFNEREFDREVRPAWGRTPFNNRLFIFRRRSLATASGRE